jgi:methionyl-tRNA formyltransferase
MRIVMMGTGGFAVPTFRWLIASAHDVPLLVTRPARPAAGRRAPPPPNPMRQTAAVHQIPCAEPESINGPESLDLLRQVAADLFIVCDYGQILSRDVLSLASRGSINLHASLLPKYRGAAPINWAIYDGQAETGVTVIHMTAGLDAGPCLTFRKVAIDQQVDACQLEAELAEVGVDAVREAVELLGAWDGVSALGTVQDKSLVTRAPRLKKADARIDWQRSARQIANQVRAFKPWPGSYTDWPRESHEPLRLIIESARAVDDDELSVATRAAARLASAGQVLPGQENRLLVQTGQGVLEIVTLKPAGKRELAAAEFLRGYPLAEAARFL